MKTYKLDTDFGNYEVIIERKFYGNGNLAILLTDARDGDAIAKITTNLFDLPDDLAFLDTNNCPWAEDFVEKYGIAENTGKTAKSGFCTYPLYRFNLSKMEA